MGDKRPAASAVLAIVVAYGLSAKAETLLGRVIDPQHRVIQGARVCLQCPTGSEARITDGEGLFRFTRQSFAEDCKIRVFHPGFALLEINIGRKRTWTLELRLAEVQQTVIVRANNLSELSFGSTSLPANQLMRISDNSDVLIRYAKQMAGVLGGSALYVDGMAADHPPPADRIESIKINADPFSAEYSDGRDAHIDILTRPAERKFRLSGGGLSLGPPDRDGLNPHLTSITRTANLGLQGPFPYLPIAFTTDAYWTDARTEVPVTAVIPTIQKTPIAAVDEAPTTNVSGSFGFGADYSRKDASHVNTSFYLWTVRQTNVNVSGITLPEAGASRYATVRELRTTFGKIGPHFSYRGGLVADWFADKSKANSSSVGISVSGAFIAGGAPINKKIAQGSRWTFKNVLEFARPHHNWSTGATVSRREDEHSVVPNPAGYIQFVSLDDYSMSATTGSHTGTALIARGQGDLRYLSNYVAPFVAGELFRGSRVLIRGGLRTDYQTGGGFQLSPRLSSVSLLHAFILRAGTGMFTQDWRNDVFLRVMENDGHHLHDFLIPNASLSDLTTGTGAPESEIVSKVAPNLTPIREWISKVSVERPFKSLVPGLECTWTSGSHLLGSDRLRTIGGWTDLLESNRALRKQEVHLRLQYKFSSQALTAHYEWIRSSDDTDGPFSFPASENDLRAEWARSAGVPTHNLTIAGNFRLIGGVSLNLMDSWRGSAPYNITTGSDPAHNGLYNDRGSMARNSGRGPASHALSLFASQRVPMRSLSGKKQPLHLNLGLQAENLFDNRNDVVLNAVRSSPIFGQALAAPPGRSLRLRLDFDQ